MIDRAERFLKIIQIKNLQKQVDKQFKKEGFNDEVLKKQLEINKLRREHNISDGSKRVYDRFVQ